MKTSFKIAQAELRILFYSPIAWFLTIIFVFQSALSFTTTLQGFQTLQDLGGGYFQSMWNFTGRAFGSMFGQTGLFADISTKIYLYLPLLTMGLISRETSSGTIKLLYSSPVKVKQIVWGKFLAMAGYSLLLSAILLIYICIAMFAIKSANPAFMLSGLLGIFLLLCTYAAIGLFMSCLTSYQVVAALSTLVVLAALNYIGQIWQGIDFVRNLTYFLSLAGRTHHMLNGLISSKDVVYFLLIIAMFLLFSYYKLKAERAAISGSRKFLQFSLTFIAVLFIGYLSTMPALILSYDATETKLHTLHPNTQKTLRDLGDDPLEVTSYINLLDQFIWQGLPNQRTQDLDRWEPYLRVKHNITLKYVYYYDKPGNEQRLVDLSKGKTIKQVAENYAKTLDLDIEQFKTPEEIKKIADLSKENNSYVIQLKYKGKTTFLRLFPDQVVFPTETEVAAGLKRLMVSLPQIVFVESELERGRNPQGERDYGVLANSIAQRQSLINQGFDTKSISLKEQDIPANTTALVIAGPRTAFSQSSLAKIEKYIDAGGNLFLAGEPGKQSIINPVLKNLGVQLLEGELVQNNDLIEKPKDSGPSMGSVGVVMSIGVGGAPTAPPLNEGMAYDVILPNLTKAAAVISWSNEKPFKDKKIISMKGSAALRYQNNGNYKIEPLLMTDERVSWIKNKKFVPDSAAVTFSSAEGDIKGSFPTLLALSRKVNGKEQRIVVAGNADFLSNLGIKRPISRDQANAELGVGLFNWFSAGQFPIDTRHADPTDTRMNTTAKQLSILKILLMGVFPGLILITGTIFLIRRKRK